MAYPYQQPAQRPDQSVNIEETRAKAFITAIKGHEASIAALMSPITDAGTSQKSFPIALTMLRAIGPDNIALPYTGGERESHLKSDTMTVEHTNKLRSNRAVYASRDGTLDYSKTEEDCLWDGKQMVIVDKHQTNRQWWEKLTAFRQAEPDQWYPLYKLMMKAIALACAIEHRAKYVVTTSAKRKIRIQNGKKIEQIQTGKTAPHLMDMHGLPPQVAPAIPFAMKGPSALLLNIIQLEANHNQNLDKLVDSLKRALKGKIGADVFQMVESADSERQKFKLVASASKGCVLDHNPPQFFDLPCLSEAVSGKGITAMWGASVPVSVVGKTFTDLKKLGEYKVACMTTAVFMPTDFALPFRRADMMFEDGEQTTQAGYHNPALKFPLVAVRVDQNPLGTTGQNTGYNPHKGMNCSIATMNQAQNYIRNTRMYEQGSSGDSLGNLFAQKAAVSTNREIKYCVGSSPHQVLTAAPAWEDFFLTGHSDDMVLKATPQKRSTLDIMEVDGPVGKKRKDK